MTSIAVLAAIQPTQFNDDFYTTAATVIPVLIFAIGVQGNLHASMLANAMEERRRTGGSVWGLIVHPSGILIFSTLLFLMLGGVSEIMAIYSLCYQHQVQFGLFNTAADLFLTTIIGLVVVAVLGAVAGWAQPILAYVDREEEATSGSERPRVTPHPAYGQETAGDE